MPKTRKEKEKMPKFQTSMQFSLIKGVFSQRVKNKFDENGQRTDFPKLLLQNADLDYFPI